MGEITIHNENLPDLINLPTCLRENSQQVERILTFVRQLGENYLKDVVVKYVNGVGIDKSVEMNAPTFHDITKMYGRKGTLFWLRLQLYKTFEFVGILDTASESQIREVSNLIITHEIYGQLTLAEFLNFLKRFKEGRYEKIYSTNHPNMQEFMMCLPAFWIDLMNVRKKKADAERRAEEERYKRSTDRMTKEEWEEIKMLTKMYEMTW